MKRFLATSMTVLTMALMSSAADAQSMTAKSTTTTQTQATMTAEKVGDIKPVRNEAEFRATVIGPGTMSLLSSQLAQSKATNAKVKEFANFETAEQSALGMILKELQTPSGDMPAKDVAAMKKLQDAPKGLVFDKEYAKAQTEGHEVLLKITESYLKNADLTSTEPKEMEARHLAYFMKAAITQHIANTKELSAMLNR